MRKQILIMCLLLLSVCGYAQQITVKGVVTAESDKLPLIGATVQLKGTTTGVITDFDGNYQLAVPQDGTLVFSMIGYKTQEINVAGKQSLMW